MSSPVPGFHGPGRIWPSVAVLAVLYTAVAAADWLAPYEYFEQRRDLVLAPPTRIHLVDAEGRWHWRPFMYRLVEHADRPGEYVEDTSQRFPLRFFTVSDTPRRWGPFEFRRRLVGVDDGARLHLMGSDPYGRDQFSRWLYGGRISLGVGIIAGAAAVALGLVAGSAAGFCGGRTDAALMRLGELFTAFPTLYLLVAVRAVLPLELRPAESFLVTVLVIGLLSWVQPARLVRGIVLSAKERDYVLAARGFGASETYLLWRHVLPRVRPVMLTHLALLVPRLVMAEVTLSFLGLGMAEPMPSWGLLLGELDRYDVLVSSWWMSLPVVALIGLVISYHHVANGLRKRLAAGAV